MAPSGEHLRGEAGIVCLQAGGDDEKVSKTGGVMSGDLNMAGNRIMTVCVCCCSVECQETVDGQRRILPQGRS